ncbi:uncharacterized protein LOC134669883 [Cydia fagiglandana]|uniref:uncharacterized protein LOC134669883 n=1 Tax=Cydia fagiglandana TaxID=1458189 RepID=UPI002FEE35DA
MRVSGRLFFIIIIHCSARSCESMNRVERHFVSLFGFRYNERSAIRSRPFVYSPIIIIPTFSQKHNFQESIGDNSYQENDVFQNLTTADTNSSNDQSLNDTDRVSFSASTIQEDTGVGIDPREVANLRLDNNTTDGILTTNIEMTTITPVTSGINTTEQVTGSLIETTKKPAGVYSAPKYDNEFLQNLSLTTLAPLTLSKFALPENNDNWKMFATSTKDNIALSTANNLFDDNQWSKLSSNLYLPGQFRPIAGLYHDGYLHRPLLNKQGFVPSRELYGPNT